MKIIVILASSLLGVGGGALAGFFGLYAVCVLLDKMQGTEGAGYVTAGWIFAFITVPAGAIIGALLAGWGASILLGRGPS